MLGGAPGGGGNLGGGETERVGVPCRGTGPGGGGTRGFVRGFSA